MLARRTLSALAVLIFCLTLSSAESSPAKKGMPNASDVLDLEDLPSGQFRRRLESLSPDAQERALQILRTVSITQSDLEYISATDFGDIYFFDPALSSADFVPKQPTEPLRKDLLDDAFLLHSLPGAPNRIYLDFTGLIFSNTAWGIGAFHALAFSLDSDRTTFSPAERQVIVEIWHRVAEDLAPFNIDVTTEEPLSFNRFTGRVLVTESIDANGNAMPRPNSGGVAFVNVFGSNNYHTYYSPALVYANNLGFEESVIAEASSHEFGHNLGLSHDGHVSGQEYYPGHGTGLLSWAPIMGASYHKQVTQWDRGEYSGATQHQNDTAIIQAKLGSRQDEAGSTQSSGQPLLVSLGGVVVASNPEIDPHNMFPRNKGIVSSPSDIDAFTFCANSGSIDLKVRPAWDAFTASLVRSANLDVGLELRDAGGSLIAAGDSQSDTWAGIAQSVSAGAYHLRVFGTGSSISPYSSYGSLGQFFINGFGALAPTPRRPEFASPSLFAVGSGPYELAAGDIDNDNDLDILTTNFTANTISVLVNNGAGMFSAQPPLVGAIAPIGIKLADINSDAWLDLLHANYNGADVSVRLGGAGGFSAPQDFATGSIPYGIIIADMNTDGKLDIVSANQGSNTVSILFGNGFGGFAPQQTYATVSTPLFPISGDFNGDGVPDLAVTNLFAYKISVWLGAGNGALGARTDYSTGSEPFGIDAGDLDRDGALDLVVANNASGDISLFYGNGDGTFRPQVRMLGKKPYRIKISDLNADGFLDIVATNLQSSSISAFIGTQCGAFHPAQEYAAGASPSGLVVSDFNNDSQLDVAITGQGTARVSIFLSSGVLDPIFANAFEK